MDAIAETAWGFADSVGWPLALTMATALVGGMRAREARRRGALNRALHELRRPLQSLALEKPEGDRATSVDLALVALADLDSAINGMAPELRPRPVSCRALVEACVERWRAPAARASRSLQLRWRAGAPLVMADPPRIAQALDNLLANAVEHGGPRIVVDARLGRHGVEVVVADTGARMPRRRMGRDPRRGHGLRVAAEVAAAHGGRLLVRRAASGTVAVLQLPLAAT